MLNRIFGTDNERRVKKLLPTLQRVRDFEREYVKKTDSELRALTGDFKERISQGASLDDVLPEAYAAVSEAAKRVAGMRPFDVQIIGGMVLHQGCIAEMVTGEGKTLVATLPVYLNALSGKGVHVITVNDYLARRDREWMGPIYEFLGLSVGLIQHHMEGPEKQVGYRADLTYGTNSEMGFDYLRDNMATHISHRLQRELNFAIVDEIDSILIDEARTPLIISGRPMKNTELYYKVDEAVRKIRKEADYELDEKGRHVMLTEDGMENVERLLGVDNLYVQDSLAIVHMVEQALRAHNFYKKDDEYVVRNGQVMLVDEFTGRIMEGRRLSDGLHQAIEAKERVPVHYETQTIASITYQNYFRLYNKLAGMTGTAATEASEFLAIYGLEVVQIPTNLPLVRADLNDLIFATENGKFNHVIREIEEFHNAGRPVLVGTVSIEKSERVAELLKERGISEFEVLNAKYHEREAAIIANAGKRKAITIATNMAGRGTDIKLGEGVRELGGLAVIGTERHESRRIDNQLRGRCGRQGDPGTTRFYVSLEDEVARLFGGDKVKRMLEWFGSQEEMDEEPLSQRMVHRSIERAQRQVEMHNFEIRKHVKEYDDVMDRQRKIIYETRKSVLEDRDVTEQMHARFEGIIADLVDEYAADDKMPDEWDLDGLVSRFKHTFGFEPNVSGEGEGEPKPLVDDLFDQVHTEYIRRERAIQEEIRASFREQVGGDESRIDFAKMARKQMHSFEMMTLLKAVDDRWIEHLYTMDYLRESVRLRAFGQKDPLVEYKTEAFDLFTDMMRNIDENVVQTLFRLTDPEVWKARRLQARQGVQGTREDPIAQFSNYSMVGADKEQDRSFAAFDTSKFNLAGGSALAKANEEDGESRSEQKPKQLPVRNMTPTVKPNDPCPCGSGKKYKKCCGAMS